jgi:hypothetical protein
MVRASWVRGAACVAVVFLVATMAVTSAAAHDPEALAGAVTPEERTAFEQAAPVFERFCFSCHSTKPGHGKPKALEHLDMDTYPFGGHHAGEAGAAVREALGATGTDPTMPDDHPGAVKGHDLHLVLAWADAFDRAHPASPDDHMDMHDHAGMDMDMEHDGAMSMGAPLGLPMQREASGTAWQPDNTPMFAHHLMAGDWMLMLHYSLFGGFDHQSGSRGDDQAIGLGWIMGMASHDLLGGQAMFRAMLSPEPPFLGKTGYPLLLQSGESVDEQPIHDRQHPHDLFMEVAASYAHELTPDVAVMVYAGLSGEPALGPVAFAHRSYAIYDMLAALGHHWQDSSHISFGVLTAAVYTRTLKLEGSWFNGREPNQDRYDFDLRTPDSFSGRLTVNPGAAWSLQASYGYLKSPEELEPDLSQQRFTTSATYDTRLGPGRNFAATAVFGRDMPSSGPSTSSVLVEADANVTSLLTLFGRFEWVEKSAGDLELPLGAESTFSVASLSLGAVHEIPPIAGIIPGLGVRGTINFVGNDLEPFYGSRTPIGLFVFIAVHPAEMHMGAMHADHEMGRHAH